MECNNKQKEICNEKFKIIFKSLNKIEKLADNMQQLTLGVNNIAGSIKVLAENDSEQNERLKKIEGKEGEKYDYIVKMIISNIVAMSIGYLFSKIK